MRLVAGFLVGLVCVSAFATEPVQRTLSFEERVKAQTAIERVYYSHQVGATKSFDQAIPKAVIEAKVRKYLEQSGALNLYWRTAVTDHSLQRELERMAAGTRMPERLQELYAALGNDPFLVKECLARATLVDRLTRNFYAFDPTTHVKERAQAEALRARLLSGELNPYANDPSRSVTELVVASTESEPAATEQSLQQALTPEEFKRQRAEYPARVGQVSDVKETREAFRIHVVLAETATSLRAANYVVPKVTWDTWWAGTRLKLRGTVVVAAASGSVDLPAPHQGRPASPNSSCADDSWSNGILDDVVPDRRTRHVAVWTGTQMIVWGGSTSGSAITQTGGRYDPITDTWTPTALTGTPSGRLSPTAVWTGNRMVVWGGTPYLGAQVYYNTGGRYDPVSDTWEPTTGQGAPRPRTGHTAVWTGTRMLVWGGSASNPDGYPAPSRTNTGGQYDPVADRWAPTSTIGAPPGRSAHTAVWTGQVMVVWGGGSTIASGGRYDPVTDWWTPTSMLNAPRGRSGHSAVWTGTEMIVWGGLSYIINDPNCGPTGICAVNVNTGGRYNPVNDTWIETSTVDAPSPRGGHTALWTGSLMIVWGRGDNSESNSGGRYDPSADTWSPTSLVGAPDQRELATAVWTGSLMVVWGGDARLVISIPFPLNTGGRYDPATDSWTPTDVTSSPGGPHPMAVWSGTLMLVWEGGGSGGRFDPATDSWAPISDIGAPSARVDYTAVWTGDLMVVWGGRGLGGPIYTSTGGRYDPVSDSWTPTSDSGAPSARGLHTAVWSGSSMLVWGGAYFDGTYHDLSSGGRYDPAADAWTPTTAIDAPSGRQKHTAIWAGNSMVVWGGGTADEFGHIQSVNTGGRYDPAADAWAPTSTADAPTARFGQTAVWTGNLMIVWGGQPGYALATGGRYDPATDAWTPTSLIHAPRARSGHSAVWTGNLMVVWGGIGNDYGYLSDELGARYDPVADGWSPTAKLGQPEQRADHAAVWTGTAMIVVGGRFSSGDGGGGQYFPGTVVDDDCDGDGLNNYAGDCDDHNASVYPGAPQICDGINDDCNDPNWPYLPDWAEPDADGDGFLACRDDCNDTNAAVYPGAAQICDGLDDDCSDPDWPAVPADEADADHDGARVCAGDCDDHYAGSGPGFREYCDGLDNDCNGVADDGPVLESCEDHNPCTDDTCGGAAGCIHTNNSIPCDDFLDCSANDVCTVGVCLGTPLTGTACDDGYVCTSDDQCNAEGRCSGHPVCDDGDPCTLDYADANNACACYHYPNWGGACDDGDVCTINDFCYGDDVLTCRPGNLIGCNDNNPCTDDYCSSPAGGCVYIPNEAVACDDGNPCTQTDTCSDGNCIGAGSLECLESCPAGFTAVAGGCAATYDINLGLLDNLRPICFGSQTDQYNDCNGSYGFHWIDLGAALGPISRVDLQFESGMHCSDGPSTVRLNGAELGEFTRAETCNCYPDHATISFADVAARSYARSAVNYVAITPTSDCEGLSASDSLGGQFARVTVTYQLPGPCVTGVCDPAMGGCTYVDRPDGEACTDGNVCTTSDLCAAGVCTGLPLSGDTCDDGNVCTSEDHCSDGVCGGAPLTGPACDDGTVCTAGETCVDGACVGTPLDCDDLNPCTDDSCDPVAGCVHVVNVNACDDGNLCTGNDACGGGACRGTPLSGTACDDGNFCTMGETCLQGVCLEGSAIGCDDGNECTDDSCDPATGCVHVDNESYCDDGNNCTLLDLCISGSCQGVTPVACDDANACTTDTCYPDQGCVITNNSNPCSDGNACTAGDVCGGGACQAGTPVACNDNNACTNDACNPATGCVFTNNANTCNDGSACTMGDTCSGGACHGITLNCDDNNPCTTDTCDPALGCVHTNNSDPCDDANACTTADACSGGACHGGPAENCDDGYPCTLDYCDPVYGCLSSPAPSSTTCNDGNVCDGVEFCDGYYGDCLSYNPLNCDDNNPCTTDSCDPATGCVHTNNSNACSDGNACTTGDACGGGSCHGTALACSDGNGCTTDTCNPATGCVFTNNTNACSDGNACTTGDACGGGSCHGTALVCNDGNGCTTDTCDFATGCVFTNNTNACNDGNACTQSDVCANGACVGSNPVACAPADSCHTGGTCNPGTGICSDGAKPDGTACNDNNLCTTGETCQAGTCTPATSGLNEPNPRTNGYYKRLCQGPHSGDQLTNADAVCVASVASNFAGISTVADICAELQPSQPNNDSCDHAEDDLMVLALNICRARVCTAQSIDSQCGNNASVGQSLSESNAILSSPSRNDGTCAQAKCLDEEVNTGRALELNSLTLRREATGIRLEWRPPYLDDGAGHPSKYHVWRRVQGSLAKFTKIGITTDPGFLDASSGSGAFEYEVTAVMN